MRAFIVRVQGWHPERDDSIVCTLVQDHQERPMLEIMLNPATAELIWTLTVTTLLLASGGLTIWLMPWSDEEIMAVHRTAKAAATSHLPASLTTTALTTAARDAQSRRPLASA